MHCAVRFCLSNMRVGAYAERLEPLERFERIFPTGYVCVVNGSGMYCRLLKCVTLQMLALS